MDDAQKHMFQDTHQQQKSSSAAAVQDALYASQMRSDNQPLYYPPHDNGDGGNVQQPPHQYSPNYGTQHQLQGTLPQQPNGPPSQINNGHPTQDELQLMRQLPNDPARNRNLDPGVLLYSAKMNRDSLKFYYFMRLYWCSGPLLERTMLDVYSQGILMNVPEGRFCCCSEDAGRFIFYDDEPFSNPPIKAGCCDPSPFLCPHCFGFCGEVVALRSGGCAAPREVGHWYCSFMINLILYKFGYRSSDMFAGLADGEADRVVAVIHRAMQAARKLERTIALPEVPKGQMM